MESINAALLSFFLSQYIEEVDSKQVKTNILSGKVTLTDLSIRSTALSSHGLPVKVVQGVVSTIDLKCPFTKLKEKPTRAFVSGIYMLGSLAGGLWSENDLASHISQFAELEKLRHRSKTSKTNIFLSSAYDIVNHLEATVEKIHIRFEVKDGDNVSSVGVMIDSIVSYTINEETKEKEFVNDDRDTICKLVRMEGVSVYVDASSMEVNREKFVEDMESSRTAPHNFIVKNFSIDATMLIPMKDLSQTFNVSLGVCALNLLFDRKQWNSISLFIDAATKCLLQRFYSPCGRPLEYSDEEAFAWWMFANRAARKKRYPLELRVDRALSFLQNRKKELKRFTGILKNKDRKLQLKLENKYGGDVCQMFLCYAVNVKQMELNRKLEESVGLDVDTSHVKIRDFDSSTTVITFNANVIKAILKNDTFEVSTFMMAMVKGTAEISSSGAKLNADIDDMIIADSIRSQNLFTLRKDEGTGSCVNVSLTLDSMRQSCSVEARASAPNIQLDFQGISQLISFFKGGVDMINLPTERERETSRLEMMWLAENHYTMNLKITLGAPEIVIPTESPIRIVLGEMTLKSTDESLERTIENPESLYDHFQVAVNGFEISVDERRICEPADALIDLASCFVRKHDLPAVKVDISLSDIVLTMNRHCYETLFSIVSLIKQIDLSSFKKVGSTQTRIEKAVSFGFSLIQKKLVFVWTDEFSSCVELNGMKVSFTGLGTEFKSEITCGSLLAMYDDHQMLRFSNDAGQSLTFQANSSKDKLGMTNVDIDLNASTIDVVLDVPKLFTLIRSFIPPQILMDEVMAFPEIDEPEPQNMNMRKIERKLQTHPNIRTRGRMDRVNIQVQGDQVLQLGLSQIAIGTNEHFHARSSANPDDFYDSVNAAVTELSLSIGDKYVIQPINADMMFKLRFIPITDMETMKLSLNIDDITIDLDDKSYKFAAKCARDIEKQIRELNLISESHDGTETEPFSMLMDISLAKLNAKVSDNEETLVDIVNGQTNLSMKMIKNDMSLNVNLNHMIGSENGKKMVELNDGLVLCFDKRATDLDEDINLTFNIKDPLLSFNDTWLKSILAFFRVPDLSHAHTRLESAQELGSARDSSRSETRKMSLTVEGSISNFQFLVGVGDEEYVLGIPSVSVKQTEKEHELGFCVNELSMSCGSRSIIAPITANGAITYGFDERCEKYRIELNLPIESLDFVLAKRDFERLLDLVDIFKFDTQPKESKESHTNIDLRIGLDIHTISISFNGSEEISAKLTDVGFKMKDQTMKILLASITLLYCDVKMIDYQNGLDLEVVNINQRRKRVTCHIDGPSLSLSTVLFGKIDVLYRKVARRLAWMSNPGSAERPIRTIVELDIVVSNISCRFQVEEYGEWTVKEFVLGSIKDDEETMTIVVNEAHLGGILSVDKVSLTYGQKSNRIVLRSSPISGKFAVRWLRDLYTIIEPFLAKTGGPPAMPRIIYDIEVPKVSLIVLGKGRNVIDVQAEQLSLKSPNGDREVSHFSGRNIVSDGYVNVDQVNGVIEWTFADQLPDQWKERLERIRPLCIDDRYLVAIAVSIDIGASVINYDQLKTQVLCESCSEMIPNENGQGRIIDVSVNLIAHQIDLMVNDIFKRSVSDARFENLEVIMHDPEDIVVKCGWYGINGGAIHPATKGDALIVKYKSDRDETSVRNSVDIEISNFLADLDVPVLSKMITILIQCPFVTFPWPKARGTVSVEVSLVISTCLIGIPVCMGSDSEYFYLTCGFDFSLRNKDIFINLRKTSASFAKCKDGDLYLPVVSHVECSFGVSQTERRRLVTVRCDRLSVDLTDADIASLMVMFEFCVKEFQQNFLFDFQTIDLQRQNEDQALALVIQVEFGGLSLSLSQDNRDVDSTQLIRIGIDECSISVDGSRSQMTTMNLKFNAVELFNFETRFYDMIVEPFVIELGMRLSPHETKIKLNFLDDLNVNVSAVGIQEIMKLVNDITYRIDNKYLQSTNTSKCYLVNGTAMKLAACVNNDSFVMEPMEAVERYMRPTDTISLPGARGIVSVTVGDLDIPTFLGRNVIVYAKTSKRGRKVILSSPMRAKNATQHFLVLAIKDKTSCHVLCEIPPHKTVPIPIHQRIDGRFVIIVKGNPLKFSDSSSFSLKNFENGTKKLLTTLDQEVPLSCVVSGARNLRNTYKIIISPVLEIHNRLPMTLTFAIGRQSQSIASGATATISEVDFSSKVVTAEIGIGDNPAMISCEFSFKGIGSIEATVTSNASSVTLGYVGKRDKENKQMSITIYAPAVVYNRTTMQLVCYHKNTFAKFTRAENVLLYGTPDYFSKPPKLQLELMSVTNDKTTVQIDCMKKNASENLLIEKTGDLYIPLFYRITSAEPFAPSSIVTIFNHAEVRNELFAPLFLQPMIDELLIGEKLRVDPGQTVMIEECSSSYKYMVSIPSDNSLGFTVLYLNSPIHVTLVMSNGYFVEVTVENTSNCLSASFKPAIAPQPYMLANLLSNVCVSTRVNRESAFDKTIDANSTSIIGFEDSSRTSVFAISVYDREITLDLSKTYKLWTIETCEGHVYATVVPNSISTRFIVVFDDMAIYDDYVQNKDCVDVKLFIPNICVALINEEPRELALAIFEGITAEMSMNSHLTNLKFYVHSFRVDDLHPSSVLQVVLMGNSSPNKHWLEFRCEMFSKAQAFTSFEAITFDVQPLTVYADVAFTSDLIEFGMRFAPQITKYAQIEPPKASDNKRNSSTVPLSARLLKFSPLQLLVYVVNNSGRPTVYPITITALKFIPNVLSGATIGVELPACRDVTMNYGYLHMMLTAAKEQLISQILSIAMNLDIIGYSTTLAKPSPRPNQNKHARRVRAVASASVVPIESMLRRGQQLMSFIPVGQEAPTVHGINQTARQTVSSGFKSAGKSFLGALTGIVQDPIRESRNPVYKNKVVGAMAGIGKGLAGIVVRPIKGVVEATTGLATGLRKTVAGDQTVFKRQRSGRAFLKRHILPYDPITAHLQALVESKCRGELITNIYNLTDGRLAVTTNEFIVIFQEREAFEIIRFFHIAHILSFSRNESCVSVTPSNGKEILFPCSSVEAALDLLKRIRSRLFVRYMVRG